MRNQQTLCLSARNFLRRSPYFVLGIVFLYLLLAAGMSLARVPICDEGWYADPAVNLLRNGSMGSPVIEEAGTFLKGIGRFTYWVMPVHILAQAGWYGVFGTGLAPLRALSLAAGLVALLCWYFTALRITGRADLATLALFLVVVNPIFLSLASTGRSDMLSVALGALAPVVYLLLRARRLPLATLGAHTLVVASGLTHPIGGLVSLATLVYLQGYLDRSRLRFRYFAVAAVPYLAGAALWSVYILKGPGEFLAQYGGNSAERLWPLKAPLVALKREIAERIVGSYLAGAAATSLARLRLLVLAAYAGAVALAAFRPELRRSRFASFYLPVLGFVFLILLFFEGAKQPWYLVHAAFPLAVLLAGAVLWLAERRHAWRFAAAGVVMVVAALELGYPMLSIVQNRYRNAYLPMVDAVRRQPGGAASVTGSAELGFGVGFERVLDDRFLGYYRHRKPDLIVLDPRYRAYLELARQERPEVYRYARALLEGGYYRQIYSNNYYSVWSKTNTQAAVSVPRSREGKP